MRYLFAILLILFPLLVNAQNEENDETLQDIFNAPTNIDDSDQNRWQESNDILTSMAQTPQNINEMTFDDLRQVPMLSEAQALAIINYRTLYGDLHTMAELSLIKALDQQSIQLLKKVCYASPIPKGGKKDSLSLGILPNDSILKAYRTRYPQTDRQWLLFTMNIPTYQRAGYKNGSYRGYALSHSLRYGYQNKRLQMAFTASQDAGEPFFAGTNKKGWDFYTGFVRLKNIGVVQNLVMGHYQMSIGMGLLMNTDYRLSRTSLFQTLSSSAVTLRGHSSRQQSNYMQGVAATVAIPVHGNRQMLTVTPFISYRNIDATVADTEPRTITTILNTGYHRTDSEIARRNTAQQLTAGASLALTLLPFRVALNVLHVSLSDSLSPNKTQIYNRYRPAGKHFTSASLSYGYVSTRLQMTGETAVSKAARYTETESQGMALATANSLRYKLSDTWTAFAVQRFYSYRYQSLLGKSFGDVSNCQDESGVYVGATTTMIRRLALSAYVDCIYHPWPRYGYKESSRSWDTYIQAAYTTQNVTATVRYRYREQALSPDGSIIPEYNGSFNGTAQHTLRTSVKYSKRRWTSITQLQGTYLPSSSAWGYLLSEGVGYNVKPVNVWCSLTYFDTNNYTSRLYLTDRTVTFGQTINMVYGRGMRLNVMLQAPVTKRITTALRCNMLHYFDRQQISSALQLIDSPNQTDLQLQVGIKL